MGMELKGFDELFNTLDNLGKVGEKVGKKAVKESLNVSLKTLKKEAPKSDGKNSFGMPVKNYNGAKKLRVTALKIYKGGTVVGQCGIDKKNWEETKHLWYQNFGFENKGLNFTGQKVTKHVGWFTEAWKKVEGEAEKVLISTVQDEIKRILK